MPLLRRPHCSVTAWRGVCVCVLVLVHAPGARHQQVITKGVSWQQLLHIAALISFLVCSLAFVALVVWTRRPVPSSSGTALAVVPSMDAAGVGRPPSKPPTPASSSCLRAGEYSNLGPGFAGCGQGEEGEEGGEWDSGDVTELSTTGGPGWRSRQLSPDGSPARPGAGACSIAWCVRVVCACAASKGVGHGSDHGYRHGCVHGWGLLRSAHPAVRAPCSVCFC